MNRGMLATIYVKPEGDAALALHAILEARFAETAFVKSAALRHRAADPPRARLRPDHHLGLRMAARWAVVMCVLDNLVKGASGD